MGTEASQIAKTGLAAVLMSPSRDLSSSRLDKNPGVSTKKIIGILKQSQNLMKRASLSHVLMFKIPLSWDGLLATIPTVCPLRRANPVMMLLTNNLWRDRKSVV